MENQPQKEKEENRLEQLKEMIKNAPESIEEEFKRTANSWLACFGSAVFRVDCYIYSPKVKVLISPEKYELACDRFEKLKEKLHNLKKQYPEKENIPPENIKQELIEELDILRG